jgi:hypothetical protein
MKKLLSILFTRENLWALLFCLILVALVIFTADYKDSWFLYEGF